MVFVHRLLGKIYFDKLVKSPAIAKKNKPDRLSICADFLEKSKA